MIVVNALQYLRSLMQDVKTHNQSLMYDDSFYVNLIRKQNLNPDTPYRSYTDDQYHFLVLEVWYSLAGDMNKIRKMEEIGLVRDSFDVEEHIRMLEFKNSKFKQEVYGELIIP